MAMKITLIVALCIAQGFAHRHFHLNDKPCKAAEAAEAIPHEFEEAMHEMDEFRETVSAAIMDSYFKGTDPKVIVACFNQQRENYAKLGQDIANKIREGAEEMAEDLGDKYEEFSKRAAEPFRKIADTLKQLPQKMWEHIKEQEFKKALEVYRESKKVVEENSRILAKLTKEFTEELPEAAEKAEKLAHDVREQARKGCMEIGMAFRRCVEEGGPKTPIEGEPQVQLPAEEAQ